MVGSGHSPRSYNSHEHNSMKRFLCLSMTLLVLSSSLLAQDDDSRGRRRGGDQQRGGPGGGGGGPGGGGGGGGRGGPGGGAQMGDPFTLLRIEEVREEIDLDEDQTEALKTLSEDLRPERPEGVDFRSMGEEERREFFTKMQAELKEKTEAAQEQLSEVLTPGQMDRLQEISLQARGAGALQDPKVAEQLKLTEEQQAELTKKNETVRDTMRERMREAFSGGDRDPEAFAKIRAEIEEDVLSVLTPGQKTQFEEMKGEKFEMPERSFGGRGGRDGRGGDRGEGGQRGGGRQRGGGDRGGRPAE